MTFSLPTRLRRGRPTIRLWSALALALLVTATGFATVAAPATGAAVYEIEGEWVDQPQTISRGNPVVAEWRINVNDDQPAPSNDPVDNVTATFSVENAFFDEIPDRCETEGVDPTSSISPDGTELTCNFGTVNMGTALVLQTPVVADGTTGEEIVLDGTSPSGEDVELPPILIQNPFVMDMQWAGTTNYVNWDSTSNPTYVDVDLEWSLRLGNGSDPGPGSITQRVSVTTQDGSPVQLGTHPDAGSESNWGVQGCTNHDLGEATGHPYSTVPGAPRHTNFVDSCTLTPVPGQPGVFDLTLTGIDYGLANVPELDSSGNPLPPDWAYVASGMVWFRVLTDTAGSIALDANEPTYTAPTGQQSTDLAGNNTSSKAYTLPGSFAATWWRPYTGSGGTNWDDTYRLPTGATVNQHVSVVFGGDNVAPSAPYGACLVFDTAYVEYVPEPPNAPFPSIRGLLQGGGPANGDPLDNPPPVEYNTGGTGDPSDFDCFSGGTWSTTPPADLSTVSAVRIRHPHSLYAAEGIDGIQFHAYTRIKDDAPLGQDIWMFGSGLRAGTTVGPGEPWDSQVITPTPGARYPATNGRRDILRVVLADPHIEKSAARSTVTPGVPADFTLTYSANGAGAVPPTVDNYRIVDTLPTGMTYVAGSADPEPTISIDQGRQVLTWVLNGVPTNTPNPLVYQAVADDTIAPGTQLTNTAVSSLGGESSAPAEETVTITTNGYTDIAKTADTPFIPNLDGEGDGEGSWTVTLRSFDPMPQAFTDTIDILPFEGDQRGTDFEGDYSLEAVEAVAGATVYYTTADPATLSDDPADPENGAPNAPSGLWSTTYTPDATAVRVIGPQLDPGATQQFTVRIATDGAEGEDLYVNRAQARTGHTELVMRTSEPMTLANYYSAALKKYVQDRNGEWRDANQVADYPSFQYGDTIRYRIVVENSGQGTIRNLDISDDQQPELGNFHVDSLAPGETQSHEYEIKLTKATSGTVVNTVCASADIPTDSQVPPTINCDPAGFEVANYTTVKSSDPRSGSTVEPGDVVTYTVTVTQEGPAPAEARFSDDLSDVLDDATYNRDVEASLGDAEFRAGRIVWTGTIPVGEVATVTYSVTVKEDIDGEFQLANVVTSPGCQVIDGETPRCTTDHTGDGDTGGLLPGTGGPELALLVLGLGLLVGGGLALSTRRRRPGAIVTDDLALLDDGR